MPPSSPFQLVTSTGIENKGGDEATNLCCCMGHNNINFISLIGVRIREDTLLEDNAPLPENFTKTQKR